LILSPANKLFKKHNSLFIVFFWLVFFLFHLYKYGVVTGLEAEKYIREAQNLATGNRFSAPRFWFYSITILIITVSLKLKIGFTGAVVIQSFLNLLSILYFNKALQQIFRSDSLFPLFICFVIISFSPYSSWNVFLFTESVFYSSILLLMSAIIRHHYSSSTGTMLPIAISLLTTILARPLGILFIPAVLLSVYTGLSKKYKLTILPVMIVGSLVLYYVTNIVFTTTDDTDITLSARQGCIVCGVVPETNAKLNLLQNGSPLQQLFYYINHNFSHFKKLSLERLEAFLFMTRPYYSFWHNVFLLVFIIPVYILSALNIFSKKEKNYRPVFYFILASIITFSIAIMLQCDDFHNRFILSLFPFFLILSAKTLDTLPIKRQSKPSFPSLPLK
jgi:hypothetical protein